MLEESGRRVKDVLVDDPVRMTVRRGIDRQGVALLGTAQSGLGLPALGVLLFEPGVQLGVLKRDGGLR